MNPQGRFSDRARNYALYRPSYPPQVIETILAGLGESSSLTVADIGAGTGISARLLANRGVKVWAIEPNLAMREVAESHPLVEWHDSNAEATQLPDACVDLVTCFQAFHWFQPQPTLEEFQRILKPQGRLAIVWNNRNREDGFTGEYSQLIASASQHHPAEKRIATIEPMVNCAEFGNLREETFPYHQKLDFSGLLGRAKSTSYLPQFGEEYEILVDNLQRLHQKWADGDGFVYLVYCTQVYIAELIDFAAEAE